MATLPEVKHNVRTRTADYIDAYFNEHERYPVDIGLIHGDFIADELYAGFDWSDDVEGFHDFSSGTPGSPLMFERWISTVESGSFQKDYVYEWDGIQWAEIEKRIGKPYWIKSQEVHKYFDGDEWVQMTGSGGTTDHRDLDHLNSANYWHLTQSEYQSFLLLPAVIYGKEDKGVAEGLVDGHESQWNHDLFLTELPIHSHAWSDISDKPSTFAPASHALVGSAHTVSGLTTGHAIKALSATTYGFAAIAWSEIASKPSTFAPSAHTHLWSEISDKPSVFAPAAHGHAWSEITGKPSTYAPASHALVSSVHTVSGLTTGHVMKALSATSFGFVALTPSEIGAPAIGTERSLSITTAGWVTIATCATGRAYGEFHVYDPTNVMHNFTKIIASTSYGKNNVSVIGGNRYSKRSIAHVRILKNSSDPIYGGAKLQVYCENPTFTLYVKQFLSQEFTNWDRWNNVTPIAEGTPTGWAQDGSTYIPNITDVGLALGGDHISCRYVTPIDGTLSIKGNQSVNGVLSVNNDIEFLNNAGTGYRTFAKRNIYNNEAWYDLSNIRYLNVDRDIHINGDIYATGPGSDLICDRSVMASEAVYTTTVYADVLKINDTTMGPGPSENLLELSCSDGQGRCIINSKRNLSIMINSPGFDETEAILINRDSGSMGEGIPHIDFWGNAVVHHKLIVDSDLFTPKVIAHSWPSDTQMLWSIAASDMFTIIPWDTDNKLTFLSHNTYWSGTKWNYRKSYGAGLIAFGANGSIEFNVVPNGTAGTVAQFGPSVVIIDSTKIQFNKPLNISGIRAGTTQATAGAAAGEVWRRTTDNVLCIGV